MEKKKVTRIVLSVLFALLIISALLSTTYALFSVDAYGAKPNDFSTGMLAIEAVSKSDTISLTNALPMTDEEGKQTTPYVFSVKNTGNLDYQFDIELLSTGEASNTFPASIIRLQIDDGEVTTLAEIGGKIKDDVILLAGESMDVSIRIWLSKDDATNDHLGMSFNSKIVTNGQAIYTSSNNEYVGPNFVEHISNLYLRNKDTDLVENNDILYRYASIYDKDDSDTTSGGLMNDRHGSMDTEEDDGNIRYYGANPNNYIYFNCNNYNNQSITDTEGKPNCELWRIIGVFDGKVKLMKNGSIGGLAWDQDKNQDPNLKTYNNDWSTSSLQEFLNGKYYDRGEDTTYTYYNGSDGSSSVSINLESIGIKNDETRGLISESLWYLKGWNSSSIYSDQMYDYERNSGKVNITSWPTTMPGNIAIPYVSDYGYAADLGSCSGKTLAQYNDTTCTSANWMKTVYGNNYGWLMAPNSSSSIYAWRVVSSGYVHNDVVYYANGVSPVLHLNSELGIKTGDGSQNTPYQIAIG